MRAVLSSNPVTRCRPSGVTQAESIGVNKNSREYEKYRRRFFRKNFRLPPYISNRRSGEAPLVLVPERTKTRETWVFGCFGGSRDHERVRMRAATVLGMSGMPQGWEGWQRSRNSEKRDEKTISSNNTTAKTCAGFGDPLRNPRHRASTRDARPAEHRFRAQQPGLYRVHRQERKNHRRVCRHTARRVPPGRAVRARSHVTPGRLGRVHSGPVGLPVPLPLCLSASPICLPLCLSASPTCLPLCLSASLPLCLSASPRL